jgi:hypothetical protein
MRCVVALVVAVCVVSGAACGGGGGISGTALAECISASGAEARFEENEFLIYDTVKLRTASGNRARIDLWDDADRARESHDSEMFDAEPEERARFALVGNAEVTWDEGPASADEQIVMRCLDDAA